MAAMLQGCSQNHIQVATAGPMTGEYAAFGAQLQLGAQQAVDDLNGHGGVLGKRLVLEVGDDACDPKQAEAVANKFASDGVVFVDGHFCSITSIVASTVYNQRGILQMSPASSSPIYTDRGGPLTFRMASRDDQQGNVAGATLATTYKGENVAILDDNSTYGRGVAAVARKTMQAAGKQEVMDSHYVAGEGDYSGLISRMKEAKVQVAYIGGYHPEIGLIARQAREQGMEVQILGPDSLYTKDLWQVSGPAGEGLMFTFAADARDLPSARAVVTEFAAKGEDPGGYVLDSYAAMQAWAAAATSADSTDPKRVADTLKSAGPWHTALGDMPFDGKGDTAPRYVWYIFHDGNYKPVAE